MVTRKTTGFTLIELLVVIAIIAILVGILFPVISSVREKARQGRCMTNMMQISTALRSYRTDYGRYPFRPYYEGTLGVYVGGVSALYPDYINETSVLVCPNDIANLRGLSSVPKNYSSYNGLVSGFVPSTGATGVDFWRFAALDGNGQYPNGVGATTVASAILYNFGGYNNYGWDTTIWNNGWSTQDPVTGPAPSFLSSNGKKWRHYPRLMNRRAPDNTIPVRCRAHHKRGGYDETESSPEPHKWRSLIVRLGGDAQGVDYNPWTEAQASGASQWKMQE